LTEKEIQAQETDLPTIRMPQVLDFMNADQEFPEIASPDSGGPYKKTRRAAHSAE
jgi:hypothetical protein